MMHIKRILLLLFLFLPPFLLQADEVSVGKAGQIAGRFFHPTRAGSSGGVRLVWSGTSPGTRGIGPACYVFEQEGGKGFVVVAGDDLVMPILGYSFDNPFLKGQMPENLSSWLEYMEAEVLRARDRGIPRTPAVKEAWRQLAVGPVVRELETASWDQMTPFNGACPEIGGSRAPTGCVITALAIVMKYHAWPEAGQGSLPGYTTDNGKAEVPGVTLGHKYDWNAMPLKYNSGTPEESRRQVARLMADCGVMLRADYGGSGTGAYTSDIPAAMADYMSYDPSARYAARGSFRTAEWHSLLQAELDAGRPVIYDGVNDEAGHAFVLDGYTEDSYYRVNWGWGGYANGYFLLTALDPGQDQGTGGSSDGYNENQGAVLGLKKEAGGVEVQELRFLQNSKASVYNGLTTSEKEFRQNTEITVTAGFITNMGTRPFTGTCMLAMLDEDGRIVEELKSLALKDLGPMEGTAATIRFRISRPILKGYRLRMLYRPEGALEWKTVKGNEEDGCVWDLVIRDSRSIEEVTSLSYVRESGLLSLEGLPEGTTVVLKDAGGRDVSSFVETVGNRCTVDTRKLEAGTYTFVLSRPGDVRELEFTVK